MHAQPSAGDQREVILEDVINAQRLSRFKIATFLLCFLILVLDGYDTVVVGYIAPALKAHFGAAPSQLAPMFGALATAVSESASSARRLSVRPSRRSRTCAKRPSLCE